MASKKATLAAGLTLNDNPFSRGLSRALSLAGKFKAGFGNMLRGLSSPLAGLGTALAGVMGVRAFAGGVKGALDFAGSLVDLRGKTGLTISSMVELGQVAKDVGLDEESLGNASNKLQKQLAIAAEGSGEARQLFHGLGEEWRFLAKQSPKSVLERVGLAIDKLGSQALKTRVSMQIFGKSGADLLPFFAELKNSGESQVALSRQASILEKNAEIFDKVSDHLARTGATFRGFFIGVAETLAPSLLKVLEQINGMDLAGWGNQVGTFLGKAIDLLRDFFLQPGAYLAAWKNGMLAIVAEIGNSIINAFMKAAQMLAGGLEGPITGLVETLDALRATPVIGDKISKSLVDSARKFRDMVSTAAKGTGASWFKSNKDWLGSGELAAKASVEPRPTFKADPIKEDVKKSLKFSPATFIGNEGLKATGGLKNIGGVGVGGAYNQSGALSQKEIRQFENKSVAEGGPRASYAGGFNTIRRGDAKLKKEAEKEKAREKLGLDKTNEILTEQTTKIGETNKILAENL